MIITAKRSIVSFLIIVMLSAAMVFRIAYISDTVYSGADAHSSGRVLNAGQTRGMIYDRNMQPLVNVEEHTMLFINPTQSALECLKEEITEEEYEKVQSYAISGSPFLFKCDGFVGQHEDIMPFTVYDRYSAGDYAVHVTGYLDSEGKGASGIEKAFDELLNRHSGKLSVRYNATASGLALSGLGFEFIDDNYASQGGIVLTIDREIQRVCEQAMDRNDIKKGAVVVLDADTSEILAMASKPSIDRNNLSSCMTDPSLPFINRALNSYSVGSIFKPVVAVAALEQGISADKVYTCNGSVDISGVVFNCHKKTGHGELNMSEAMAVSCNSYFIQLGQAVGAESILDVASRLGLGREIFLCDSMASDSGNLPLYNEIDSRPSLANISFGQGPLLASPLQIAAMYCSFANGGYLREPYILKSMIDDDGTAYAEYRNESEAKVLTENICREINLMLSETIKSGSGMLAKPMCYDAAGKTATAETGQTDYGREIVHTWFAGYYPVVDPEYIIVVFREDGNTSSTDCAPVFRDVADGITAVCGD